MSAEMSPLAGVDQEPPQAAYAAALACLPAVGPAWLVEVLAQHSPKAAWQLVRSGELSRPARSRPTPGGPEWSEAARRLDVGSLWAYCQKRGIAVTWPGAPGYPSALRSGPAPAGVLFSHGSLGLLEGRPSVALIGTRRCTREGREVAYQLGYDLCSAGAVIVSGLALGIDGAAHAGALAAARDAGADADGGAGAAGSTVGVAASGVDVVYPRQHAALWGEVGRTGAIVSETPPGSPAQAWRFPSRNRIIAGLAQMVVVVECHASGGSWHTVEAAVRRGIEVGAVPGWVHSPASVGTNTLLHEGATPVRGAQDVLDALGIFDNPGQLRRSPGPRRDPGRTEAAAGPFPGRGKVSPPPRRGRGAEMGTVPGAGAGPGAAAHVVGGSGPRGPIDDRVLAAVSGRSLCLEDIVERSGLPVTAVVVALERLEEQGTLRGEGGWWARARQPTRT
ncbi:MAG TPA: DNA-processing protein DprA [Acidimicrobiales bacterium]|nr:DNA-processing protein DprA [Acidimicrobiales bacterium]